ncbi:MAG: hypothetical protein QOG15_3711 [Solirubrobacteraceae bacterium]|jgi:hypothetical protein|nr:hypothetical protein [Solirubrobacteraceae bacterium]
MPRRLLVILTGGLLLLLCIPALAAAAPVTVDLRIEGKTSTLYEGTVTTDIRTIDVGDGTGAHTCDGTNNGANPTPGPTRGAAFAAAAAGPAGFSFQGTWYPGFQDVTFETIAGQSVAFEMPDQFLVEYKNAVSASVGSCQDQIASGDDVLYAYGNGSEQLLKLAGPATVTPGATATLHVTDAATGTPVAGATVNGTQSTADGSVAFALPAPGPVKFKASKAGAIRSNSVTVCASSGADGACGSVTPTPCETTGRDGLCGTRDLTAPRATILGISDRQHFARKKAPRHLRARVSGDPSGLLFSKLRLTRNAGRGRCTYFNGRTERFRRGLLINGTRCGATHGHWFKVGDEPDVDYLLPKRLPRGRYVLDVTAIDRAYNRDNGRVRGRNRVVFYVK